MSNGINGLYGGYVPSLNPPTMYGPQTSPIPYPQTSPQYYTGTLPNTTGIRYQTEISSADFIEVPMFYGTRRLLRRLGAKFRLYCESGKHWCVLVKTKRLAPAIDQYSEGKPKTRIWCVPCIVKMDLQAGGSA